jgi:uncharacterized protein YneF (UPF0154 family)
MTRSRLSAIQLLDHLVGGREQRRRNRQAERLGRFEVNRRFVLKGNFVLAPTLGVRGNTRRVIFMKKTLLILIFVAVGFPAMAKPYHGTLEQHSNVNCEMVRAYVAQNGLVQARAMAQAAGMTASEERKARGCLAKKI